MYKDPFTGRYHTHFRDYDPITCRWNMEDPAGYADGLNLYGAYMGVNGRDVLGLAEDDMGFFKRCWWGMKFIGEGFVSKFKQSANAFGGLGKNIYDYEMTKQRTGKSVLDNPAVSKALTETIPDPVTGIKGFATGTVIVYVSVLTGGGTNYLVLRAGGSESFATTLGLGTSGFVDGAGFSLAQGNDIKTALRDGGMGTMFSMLGPTTSGVLKQSKYAIQTGISKAKAIDYNNIFKLENWEMQQTGVLMIGALKYKGPTVKLYRGLHAGHPDIQNAMNGKIVAPGFEVDPNAHNLGLITVDDSALTAWTTDPSQAAWMANRYGKGGIVVVVEVPRSKLISSPDFHKEAEIFLEGTVNNIKNIGSSTGIEGIPKPKSKVKLD